MAVYVDASALIPLIVAEPHSRWARARIIFREDERFVSDFAAAEVAATISKFVRMRRFSPDLGNELLAAFDGWMAADAVRVSLSSSDVVEADRLVRRFELMLRAPDALHLALAMRHKAMLVTRDLAMACAAEMLGIAMEPLPG